MSTLVYEPALSRPGLLAPPVAAALRALPWADEVRVAEIDPALSDTAAFCAEYGVAPEESANCVVIAGKRGGETSYAACMVAATTRADVNGLVRKHLNVRKASFGAVDTVTSLTGMEYGGITPGARWSSSARPTRRNWAASPSSDASAKAAWAPSTSARRKTASPWP